MRATKRLVRRRDFLCLSLVAAAAASCGPAEQGTMAAPQGKVGGGKKRLERLQAKDVPKVSVVPKAGPSGRRGGRER
jgi:hypothetical protein